MSTAEQLDSERRQRPRAAIAAAGSALCTAIGGVMQTLVLRDVPGVSVLSSLSRAAEPGEIGAQPSLKIPQYDYLHDKFLPLLIGALLIGLGAFLAGRALQSLARATKARTDSMPRIAVAVPIVGGTLYGIGSILFVIARDGFAQDITRTEGTIEAIKALDTPGLLIMGSLLLQVGLLVFATAYVLVALNAMRVGLLTRFMGILGIIVGVSLILPFLQGLVLLNTFWLFALAALFLGRWPGGVPPAWESGRAEPWPSAAQLRAQSAAARDDQAPEPAGDDDPPLDPEEERPAHPSSKKKKRKRRT